MLSCSLRPFALSSPDFAQAMLSEEVRWNILVLYYDRQLTFHEISELVTTTKHKTCERTVRRTVQRFEATGEVSPY